MSDLDDALERADYGYSGSVAEVIQDRNILAAEVKRLRTLYGEACQDIDRLRAQVQDGARLRLRY